MFNKYLNRTNILFLSWSIVILVLTYLSLHKALSFGFWRDDWLYVWVLKTAKDPSLFDGTKLGVSYLLDLYRLIFISHFVDSSPLGWQTSSVFFRAVVPFTSTLFIFSVTRSKWTALLTGLFLAAGIAGVEPASFLGANNVTFFIIFLTLGYYFWITSLKEAEKNKQISLSQLFNWRYGVALIILAVLAKGEQWSYYVIPLVSLIWDILYLLENRTINNLKLIFARNLLLCLLLAILFPIEPNGLKNDNGLAKLRGIKVDNIKNLLASLGNLSVGSLIYIPESGGLSSPYIKSITTGVLTLIITSLTGLWFLFKPSKINKAVFFLLSWTILFYIPNWVFESTLTVGASHRYLAISAVGLYAVFAYFLTCYFNKKLIIVIAIVFIADNIYLSNKVLSGLDLFRSEVKIQSIIKSMNHAIPNDQKDFIVNYEGDGLMKGYILDWSLGIPLAMERNIKDRKNFPIWGISDEKIIKLLCGQTIDVNLVGRGESYQRGGYKFSLDQLHSFYIKDSGEVIDESEAKRKEFDVNKDCKQESPLQ